MNSDERVQTAIDHKEPDRIPLDLGSGHACKFTKYFYIKLLDYFGFDEEKFDICQMPYQLVYASDQVLDALKTDIRNPRIHYLSEHPSPYVKTWEEGDYIYKRNAFGSTYRSPKEHGLYFDLYKGILEDSQSEEDDEKYIWPVPERIIPGSRKELEDYKTAGYYRATDQVFGNGFFQTGPLVWGYQNWFMMMQCYPERCKPFIETLFEKKLEWYTHLFEEYDGTLELTSEADDFGTQRGLFINPDILREMVFPYHKKLNDFIKSKQPGIRTTLHTCGSVYDIIPDIIEMGYDCLNPVQITCAKMDPTTLKREFGDQITFWGGGIGTQHTLPMGTVQEVKEETKRNIDAFAPGGGFIFSPVHNIQQDVPIENFMAMWETFQENCTY